MNFTRRLKGVLRLTRIEHSIMLVVAVLAGELLTLGKLPSILILAFSLITPIFISMASFAINDYFDVEVDKLNKKKRPLVTGEITKNEAIYITIICLFIGVFTSLFINIYAFLIAVIFGALAMLYSYKLKELPILGNLYIAFSMAIPFIYGDFVVKNTLVLSIYIVSIMIFLSGVAREIHGTIRDYEGDRKRNVVSLPHLIGIKPSAVIAAILYLIAVLISAYLFLNLNQFQNFAYLFLIAITDIILIYVSVGYIIKKSKKFYDFSRNISLVAMSIALVAIFITAIM
ncbi:MAG: UbiA family prenyltransferase [Candidatus Micrarchaeia archaeon]